MKFKSKSVLAACILSVFIVAPIQAFDFGSWGKKATESLSGGMTDYLKIGKDLYTAFGGNQDLINSAKDLLTAFKAGDYLKGFDFYDTIEAAKLTPEQAEVWNDTKNVLSSFALDKSFEGETGKTETMVEKAVSALQGNDVTKASKYLSKLKQASELSPEQSGILSSVIQHLGPVLSGQ